MPVSAISFRRALKSRQVIFWFDSSISSTPQSSTFVATTYFTRQNITHGDVQSLGQCRASNQPESKQSPEEGCNRPTTISRTETVEFEDLLATQPYRHPCHGYSPANDHGCCRSSS